MQVCPISPVTSSWHCPSHPGDAATPASDVFPSLFSTTVPDWAGLWQGLWRRGGVPSSGPWLLRGQPRPKQTASDLGCRNCQGDPRWPWLGRAIKDAPPSFVVPKLLPMVKWYFGYECLFKMRNIILLQAVYMVHFVP